MIYRKEIDGLRAVAVFSVILYHAGYSYFKGGYVGVDVFFVISGFLITSIILKDLSVNNFKIKEFYFKRIRRIIPALFFVVATVTLLSFALLLPSDLRAFGKSLASIPLFSSNFIFFLEGGYFEISANIKPLFHTWSLGIEEQFYLLYPFFLIFIWGKNSRLFWYSLVLILSFLISLWWTTNHPEASYLLLPSRIWEFFIGGIVAFFGNSSGIKKLLKIKFFAQLLSFLGLVLITFPVFYFNELTKFPGINALVPVLGAGLLILFASEKTYVGRFLGNQLFVKTGLISFSLYLWHQPVFVFFRIFYNENPDHFERLYLILLTCLLSFGTWLYIEIPFRSGKYSNKIITWLVGCFSFLFIIIGAHIYSTNGMGSYYTSEDLIELYSTNIISDTRCHANDRKSAEDIGSDDVCKFGNNSLVPKFAIIGDSHASTLFGYLDEVYTSRSSFVGISNGNCPPLINGFILKGLSVEDCELVNKAVFDFLERQDSIKTVVLFAEWGNYTEGYRLDSQLSKVKISLAESIDRKALKVSDNAAIFSKAVVDTVDYLNEIGKQVIIIKSNPEFREKVMDSIGRQIIHKINPQHRTSPSISTLDYDQRNFKVNEIFSKLTNVKFINTKSLMCNKEKCHSVDESNKILYSDTNHLTYNGSKLIVDDVVRLLVDKD